MSDTKKSNVATLSGQKRLRDHDKDLFDIIEKEKMRQYTGLELIASENFTSTAVMECTSLSHSLSLSLSRSLITRRSLCLSHQSVTPTLKHTHKQVLDLVSRTSTLRDYLTRDTTEVTSTSIRSRSCVRNELWRRIVWTSPSGESTFSLTAEVPRTLRCTFKFFFNKLTRTPTLKHTNTGTPEFSSLMIVSWDWIFPAVDISHTDSTR